MKCSKAYSTFLFSLHNVSHLIQWILRSPCLLPHQNLLIILSICSHKPIGSREQLITYVGIAWTTNLIKTSLPAFDRNFSFQPFSFFHTLSWTKLKTCFLDLPTKAGSPRYFEWHSTTLICIQPWNKILRSSGTFQLKEISDLSKLISCLEAD